MPDRPDLAAGDLGWSILELMGHRMLAGYLTEQIVAGAAMLRIDCYAGDEPTPRASQFYAAGAIYAITPTTEQNARAIAGSRWLGPATRWDMQHELTAGRAELDGM